MSAPPSPAVFADTGVLLAYFDPRDARSGAARALLRNQRITTTNFVVDELLTLGLARRGTSFALRLAARVWDGNLFDLTRVSEEDEVRARHFFLRLAGVGASYTDCTSFAAIERLRLPVAYSFDHHFRIPGAFVVRP